MSAKQYIAIYDEQKLISDFIHNNLEHYHKYNVLFSTKSEDILFSSLTAEVELLLFHCNSLSQHKIQVLKKILEKFERLKAVIYTLHIDSLQKEFGNLPATRIRIVSELNGASEFLEAIITLLPEHKNHKEVKSKRKEYILSGFEKIKQNRKWVLILRMIADGKKPKEIADIAGLKYETVNSYIELMVKETGCGNISEVLLEAERKNII